MRNQLHAVLLATLAAVFWTCSPSNTASAQVDAPSEGQTPDEQGHSDAAAVAPRVRVAAKESIPVFNVELILYSIRLGQSPGDIQYYADGRALVAGRERLERILRMPVGIVFEDIHIMDVCDFITDTYDLNLILDKRVIRPPKSGNSGGSINPPDAEYVTDGIISYANLKNVQLGVALKALLRPLGLDYSVELDFIWISTPEKIASESFGFFYRPSSKFTFRQEGAYVFHDKETLLLGRPNLSWGGRARPSDVDIERLARPSMRLPEGLEGVVEISDGTPIQYFEAVEAGDENTFVLKTLDVSTGFRASVIVNRTGPVEEASVQLSLDVSLVGARLPLDGVSLNVGKPMVTRTPHSDVHTIALGRWASLIGSERSDSALLLLIKVSPDEDAEPASQVDNEGEYIVESKIIRYLGKLNQEKLKSKVESPSVVPIGSDAFRLKDGILPLRKKDIDFSNPKTVDRISKMRGFELMSAPRIALVGTKARQGDTGYKLVVTNSGMVSNSERALRALTPKNHQMLLSASRLAGHGIFKEIESHWFPLSKERMVGLGIFADVASYWLPRTDTRDVNGGTVELSGYYASFTGALLAVRVDDSSEEHPPALDFYAQVRTKVDEEEGIAKRHDEAEATRSFFDFEDRVEFEEGEWLTYLVSLSEEEHYITLISVTRMSSKD